MTLQHFNYFWWDSEVRRIILCGTSWNESFFRNFFPLKCHVKGRERGQEECVLHHWTSGWRSRHQMTQDWHDLLMRCTLVHTKMRSGRLVHGYFQSQFRVSLYKEVDRPTHESIKREQVLTTVTNDFMTQYTIPIDTTNWPSYPVGTMWKSRRRWRKNRIQLDNFLDSRYQTKETEESEEEPDTVRELLSTHSGWLRMWKKILQYFQSWLHSDLLSKRYRLNRSVSPWGTMEREARHVPGSLR
jgi:hypothetical protein